MSNIINKLSLFALLCVSTSAMAEYQYKSDCKPSGEDVCNVINNKEVAFSQFKPPVSFVSTKEGEEYSPFGTAVGNIVKIGSGTDAGTDADTGTSTSKTWP